MLYRWFIIAVAAIALSGMISTRTHASSQVAFAASLTRETIFLSVNPNNVVAVAREIQRSGGSIRFEQDAVGYIRAAVPAASIMRLERSPGVDAFEVSDPAAEEQLTKQATNGDAALKQTILEQWKKFPVLPHPYFASTEIGQDVWLRRHPSYDGRGAVIAIVEPGAPDFLHPEFGPARTIHGNLVPKFLDVVPVSHPNSGHQSGPYDSFWIEVSQQVRAKGRDILWDGLQYHVPRPGSYAVASLHVPTETPQSFFVLWDRRARTLRLAPSGSHDFTRSEEVREYRRTQRFGHIQIAGKTLGYAVFATPDGKHVYISLGLADHATMAISTAAGNRLHGGIFTGVAPSAQITSYVVDQSTNTFEGVLRAAADPRVDIISCSCSIKIRASETTSVVVDHVLARFARAFHKPFTSAAEEMEPAVIGVAPYDSSRMFERNLGITGSPDYMWAPLVRDDGLIYPDILEPERSLAADSRFLPSAYLEGFFQAPRDYMIGGGASNATPFAAGMIADLVSAGKQKHISVHVRDLRSALWTASSWAALSDQQQMKQRLPLLEPVWTAFERASRLDVPAFDVRAPIVLLGRPVTSGGGVLDESAAVGRTVRRTILVTQHGGGAECCALQLRHSDGSFEIDTRASMKIGNVWQIVLIERPSTSGEHIAELDFVDKTGVVFQAVPLTLRTPFTQAMASVVLHGYAQRTEYIAGHFDRAVHLTIISVKGENVSMVLVSPNNRFFVISLANDTLHSHGLAQSWKAHVSISRRQEGENRIADVTIPRGPGLWRLEMSRNAEASYAKPGPYSPGSDTVQLNLW